MSNALISPIYDRTQTDIVNRTSKAFINLADWLRIKENTDFIHALVEYVLDTSIAQNTLTEPTITTFPTADEINDFLENIENVRAALPLPALLALPTIKHNWAEGFGAFAPNYLSANDWERVIYFVFRYIITSADYYVYCGVATVGQARFYQSRWRLQDWWNFPFTVVRTARTGKATTGASATRNNKFRSG